MSSATPTTPFIAYFTSYSGDRLLFFLELNSSTAAKTLVFGQKGGRTAEDVWVGAFGLISFKLASILSKEEIADQDQTEAPTMCFILPPRHCIFYFPERVCLVR